VYNQLRGQQVKITKSHNAQTRNVLQHNIRKEGSVNFELGKTMKCHISRTVQLRGQRSRSQIQGHIT